MPKRAWNRHKGPYVYSATSGLKLKNGLTCAGPGSAVIQVAGHCLIGCKCFGCSWVQFLGGMLGTTSRSPKETATSKHPWLDREMWIPVMKVTPQHWRHKSWVQILPAPFVSRNLRWTDLNGQFIEMCIRPHFNRRFVIFFASPPNDASSLILTKYKLTNVEDKLRTSVWIHSRLNHFLT